MNHRSLLLLEQTLEAADTANAALTLEFYVNIAMQVGSLFAMKATARDSEI